MMTTLRDARLRRDLSAVASQVQGLLTNLGEEGSERLQGLRDRVSSAASDLSASARDRFSSLDTTVRKSAKQAARMTDDYVHHNPWRAIGIGAVAGIVIGYLVSSSSRR